jgi:hypothetical protein
MRQPKLRPWLVTLVGSLLLFGSAMAYALPAREVIKLYFSGPDKRLVVGGSILPCQGGYRSWGQRTQWYVQTTTSCANY